MGSLESRIGRLEERVSAESEAPVGGRDNLWTKVWQLTLDAIARIRRAPIAEDHARYTVGGLKEQSPMSTACHIIALTHLGHEDEEEARDVLAKVEEEQGLEGSPLWRMIDEIVAALEQMREENRAS